MSPAERAAVPADDEFHAFDAAEWWSIETLWFGFTVPERALNGVIYLVCRPAMNVCMLQINVFDASGHLPWQNRHWRSQPHLPLPASLKRFEMADVGFGFEVLEPLTRYAIRYRAENVRFELEWSALMAPRMSGGHHIDQFGRMAGVLELDGEVIPVDCLQMRDRSWTRRSDLEGVQGAYTYALASPDHALLMGSARTGDECVAQGGWLLRDGQMTDLRSGGRSVLERGPSGEPLVVKLWGQDKDGRSFEAKGEAVSRSVMQTSGNILAWDTLMRWELDGATCWGEDQDVWTPQTWKAEFER